MRVLHVHSGNLYGGVETLLSTLWRERAACSQMTSSFALCFEGRLSQELRAAGARVYMLGNVRASRPLTVRRARAALTRLLKTNGFDIVVCHSAWSQALVGAVVCAAQMPSVFWLHDAITGKHWLERWARRTPPALVIANSYFTAGAARCIYPYVETQVIYYPVSTSEAPARMPAHERASVRAQLETQETATVVVQVGRMERLKGHVTHFEALGLLKDVPNWVCWQVGGAQRPSEVEYVNELKRQALRLGIQDRVHFIGERRDVMRVLSAADIYCQPNNKAESFGLTFVEAMLAGLPVVTTAIGGAIEVVHKSGGTLVGEGDVDGLSQVLRTLIGDAQLRMLLGARGPARARELCDPVKQLNQLTQVLLATVSYRSADKTPFTLQGARAI